MSARVHPRMRAVLHRARLLDVATSNQLVRENADPGPAASGRLRSGGDLSRSRRPAPRAGGPRSAAATTRCGDGSGKAVPMRSPVSSSAIRPRVPRKSPRRPRRTASSIEPAMNNGDISDVGQPNANTGMVMYPSRAMGRTPLAALTNSAIARSNGYRRLLIEHRDSRSAAIQNQISPAPAVGARRPVRPVPVASRAARARRPRRYRDPHRTRRRYRWPAAPA